MSPQDALAALLEEKGVIILDGAQGTELERRGVNLGSSKLWSAQLLIDDPDLVRAIHLDYLRAGADVITTFTYQASPQGFAQAGVGADRAAALLNLAVDLAEAARSRYLAEQEEQESEQEQKHAGPDAVGCPAATPASAPTPAHPAEHPVATSQPAASAAAAAGAHSRQQRRRPLIAFSCGSYGGYLADGSEFRGSYADSMSLDELAAFHRARLEPVRHRTEIDLLAFETVPCAKEAEAIVRLLRAERYGKPAWISFSCRDAVHTCHGEGLAERCVPLLAAAAAEGLVAAAGVNCTAPRFVGPLLAAARARLEEWYAAGGPTAAEGASGSVGRGSSAAGEVAREAGHVKQQDWGDQPGQRQPPHPAGELVMRPQDEDHGSHRRRLLLLVYPNSGEEWDGQHRCWLHCPDDIAEPGRFAEAARGWVRGEAGVALVGGCCRTGPDHIRALRRVLGSGARQGGS